MKNFYLKNDDCYHPEYLKGAKFVGKYQMPELLKQDIETPEKLLSFGKRKLTKDFSETIHFYMGDPTFSQVFKKPDKYLEQLKKFPSIIGTDKSLYFDMPLALQIANTYLNREWDYYAQSQGYKVIPNVRWSDKRSYEFCFDGLPKNHIVSIGSHGCIKTYEEKYLFKEGLNEMLNRLHCHTVIVYGAMPKDVFDDFKGRTTFVHFESEYSKTHRKGDDNNGIR